MIKLVALTARNTVAQHLVALCLLPRLPGLIISQIFDDTNFFRGMYPLTSRCFCSCLSCLPYSERARVRCLGLHSRNPAVEHFQERQWIQPPWNIALKIWSSNIYSILYMANNIHICIWPCSSFWTCSPTWHSSPSDPTRCSALPHTWVFHLILIEERLVKLVQWLLQYFMVFSLTRISALGWWSLRGRYEQVLSKIFKPWKFPLIPFFRQQINWINQVLVPLAGLIRAVMLHEFYCNCWRFKGFTLIFMDMIDYKIYVHDWLYQYSEKYRNLEKKGFFVPVLTDHSHMLEHVAPKIWREGGRRLA